MYKKEIEMFEYSLKMIYGNGHERNSPEVAQLINEYRLFFDEPYLNEKADEVYRILDAQKEIELPQCEIQEQVEKELAEQAEEDMLQRLECVHYHHMVSVCMQD